MPTKKEKSEPLSRGQLGREPLVKVGATSQPLGFPAPLARPAHFLVARLANGTGRAHGLSIRGTPEIRYGSNGFRVLTCFEVSLHPHCSPPPLPLPLSLRNGTISPVPLSSRSVSSKICFVEAGSSARSTLPIVIPSAVSAAIGIEGSWQHARTSQTKSEHLAPVTRRGTTSRAHCCLHSGRSSVRFFRLGLRVRRNTPWSRGQRAKKTIPHAPLLLVMQSPFLRASPFLNATFSRWLRIPVEGVVEQAPAKNHGKTK